MNVLLTMETVHITVLMLKAAMFVPVKMGIHYIVMEKVVLVYISYIVYE